MTRNATRLGGSRPTRGLDQPAASAGSMITIEDCENEVDSGSQHPRLSEQYSLREPCDRTLVVGRVSDPGERGTARTRGDRPKRDV
jgi:hypothetical protein